MTRLAFEGPGYVSSEDEDFETPTHLNGKLPPTLSPLLHPTAGKGSKVYSPPPPLLPMRHNSHHHAPPMPRVAAPTASSRSNPAAAAAASSSASLAKLPPAYRPSGHPRPHASDEEVLEIKHAFKAFDFEQSGGLDIQRIKGALEALQLEAQVGDLEHEVAELGRGPDTLVDLREFVEIASARYAQRTRRQEALLVFRSWEGLPSGAGSNKKMTLKSLRNATKQMGVAVGDDELRAMLAEAGDEDGIDFEAFWRAAVPGDDDDVGGGGNGIVHGDDSGGIGGGAGRDELHYASVQG